MEKIFFYGFSTLAIASALCVILLPNMVRALLSLIVTMFSLSVLYLMLGAPFVAMVNLIVYAGAVLVLFLFVIMLQGIGGNSTPFPARFPKGLGIVSAIGISFFIFVFLKVIGRVHGFQPLAKLDGSAEAIGQKLFFDYLMPFELISVLLLVGVFAAVALAKEDKSIKGPRS